MREEEREGRREGERKKKWEGQEREGDWLPYICQLFAVWPPKCLLSPLLLDAYSAAISCTVGFSSSCAHPPANSHEINSTHTSFYLHHLAEAKNSLPKYPPQDKTYHPIASMHIYLAYNCLSGLGSFEIRDLFLLPLHFIREGLSSI